MSSKTASPLSFFFLFLANCCLSNVLAHPSDPMKGNHVIISTDTTFIDQIHLERKQDQQSFVFHFHATRQMNSTLYLKRVDKGVVYKRDLLIAAGRNSLEVDMKSLEAGNYLVYLENAMTKYGTKAFLISR